MLKERMVEYYFHKLTSNYNKLSLASGKNNFYTKSRKEMTLLSLECIHFGGNISNYLTAAKMINV